MRRLLLTLTAVLSVGLLSGQTPALAQPQPPDITEGLRLSDPEEKAPAAPAATDDDPDRLDADPAEALEPEAGVLPDGEVERILVMGNRRVEDEAVRQNVATRRGIPLNARTLREDVRRVWDLGFFTYVMVDVSDGVRGPIVTFVVEEKPSVSAVKVEGNDEIDLEKIEEVIEIKAFSILNRNKVQDAVTKIRNLYSEKGFFLAEVGYRLDERPDNQVDVVFEINENAKVVVKQISFIGNESIPDEELQAVMQTRVGDIFSFLTQSGTYNEEVFQRDAVIVSYYYYDRGYINAKVGQPTVRISHDKKFLYLSLSIEEGEQYYLGDVDVSGDILTTKEDLLKRITLEKGDVFNRSQILGRDLVAIADVYRNRGYAYANVTPLSDIDPDTRMIDLTLDIKKGELVYFDRISIRGNTKTADHVIRREMKVFEGELYSQRGIDRSRARITALGFFEKVDISTRPGAERHLMSVEVTVKEKPTGTFQIGIGFSSVENFVAQAQISEQNLFGRGQSLSLQFVLSSLRRNIDLSFFEPYFLNTSWTFAFSAFNRQQDFVDFVRDSTGGSLTFGYRLTDAWRTFLTYKLESVDANALFRNDIPPANLFADGITSSAQVTVAYDTRDNRLFPRDGMYHTAGVEIAAKEIGSQNEFFRGTGQMRFYVPLPFRSVFKSSVRGEYLGAMNQSGIPIFERTFEGGVFSIRGYRLRSISPKRLRAIREPNGRSTEYRIGGNKALVFNNEIEFPIFEEVGIRGVLFYDAGNTYAEGEWPFYINTPDDDPTVDRFGFNPRRDLPLGLFHSVGFGFRWFSPIGPLRFEWGIPLVRRPEDETILFEFTIGNFL